MNLKPGHRLAYTVTRETYYANYADADDSIYIGSTDDNATDWEFKVSADADEDGLKVELFDDAFRAFAEAPEVFAALAHLVDNAPMTLANVRAQLDWFDAVDVTPRRTPVGRR